MRHFESDLEDGVAMARRLVIDANQWWPHVDTSLEIAVSYSIDGDFVGYLNLCDLLDLKFGRMWPQWVEALVPRIRASEIVERVNEQWGTRIEFLRPEIPDCSEDVEIQVRMISNCSDSEAIKQTRYEDLDLGYGVLSSVYSDVKTVDVPLRTLKHLSCREARQAVRTYSVVQQVIRDYAFDSLVVFNGRFAIERAAWKAARSLGVTVEFHESLNFDDKFYVTQWPIHSAGDYCQNARDLWFSSSDKERNRVAQEWFGSRFSRNDLSMARFARNWAEDVRLASWSPKKDPSGRKKFVIFTSSDDEFAAVDSEYDLPEAMSQLQLATRAVRLARAEGYDVVVRLHPNFRNKSNSMRKGWSSLAGAGASIVDPGSDLNSYSLALDAAAVATFGSTIGVESAYLGTPTALLGPALFSEMEISAKCFDEQSISKFLRSPETAIDRERALLGAKTFAHFEASRWQKRTKVNRSQRVGLHAVVKDQFWLRGLATYRRARSVRVR